MKGKIMYHNQELIDKVLDQIVKDIEAKDLTAIEELLQYVPVEYLQEFLSDWH